MVCPDMFQCHALIFHPLGSAARDFNKNIRAAAAANKNSPNQQTNTGGRDPYGIFKEAILSKPDEQQVQAVAREDEETRRLRRKHMSRNALREHKRVNGHLTRLIKLSKLAIAALPVELQSEAAKQDFTPFPVQRRIFTETPPIPDFKAKVAKR